MKPKKNYPTQTSLPDEEKQSSAQPTTVAKTVEEWKVWKIIGPNKVGASTPDGVMRPILVRNSRAYKMGSVIEVAGNAESGFREVNAPRVKRVIAG